MAARDNPFYIQPPNVYEALISGVGGYERGQKSLERDALREAGQLYAAGDIKGAMAAASRAGNLQGLVSFAGLQNQDRQFGLEKERFGETSRHNKATEGLASSGQAETRAQHERSYGLQKEQLDETKRQHEVTNLQPVKIGDDGWGGSIYAIRDPKSPNGYRVINAQEAAPKNITSGEVTGVEYGPVETNKPQQTLTGDAYIKTLDPGRAALTKKITSYELDPRTLSNRGGHRERALAAAAQYDPTYDQTQFASRAQAVKNFAAGVEGRTTRSLNVIVDHAETLRGLGEALKNGDIQVFNRVAQRWAQETGSPAPTNFDMAKQIVGTELIKALGVAGAGTEDERKELGQRMSRASSPAQIVGIIDGVVRPLLGGQLRGLRQQFTTSTRLPEERFNEMLFPNTRKFLDGGGASAQPGPAAPKIGEVRDGYRFKGGNPGDQNSWVQVK